jgi:hypothetical protein
LPILGIDSDNGSEFINWELFHWCEQEQLTFTGSRSGNKNDGAHVEQKNWHVIGQVVGYHRYDSAGELELLNKIWQHNPAAIQRQIQTLTGELLALTTSKQGPKTQPAMRAFSNDYSGDVRRLVSCKVYCSPQPSLIQNFSSPGRLMQLLPI